MTTEFRDKRKQTIKAVIKESEAVSNGERPLVKDELTKLTQDLMVKVGMADGCVVVCDRCAMELVLIHTAFIDCDYGTEEERQHVISLMERGGVDIQGAVLGLSAYGREEGTASVLCGHCVMRVTNDLADDYLRAEIADGWPIGWEEPRVGGRVKT